MAINARFERMKGLKEEGEIEIENLQVLSIYAMHALSLKNTYLPFWRLLLDANDRTLPISCFDSNCCYAKH